MTVPVDLARELLDMGARLRRPEHGAAPLPQAEEQLQGAVAVHNILKSEGLAYLADEVGMGKTYVALGAIALFRHFQPDFRVAVIAPRENIQTKWMKEWSNFATYIVRIPDLRVRGLHGGAARPLAKCDNLQQFVRETTLDADRDFFLRFSSFSLGAGDGEPELRSLRDKFQRELPWVADAIQSLKSKREFKDNLGKAICCALPVFDLLVVDEAHNLKHGFAERIAARNRVLAFAFGRPSESVDRRDFPHYGPRAKRVLFLSATPIEDDYRQLWNQLDVFGKGEQYAVLRDSQATEDQKRTAARRFLVRRVTSLEVDGRRLTKNLYRREWRRGGVARHDEPIRVEDVRQRLVVALVQKKVSELLNTEKFGASFQMGMLASFESFLETAKLKKADEDTGNFDDADQTEDDLEREGIDVRSINALAADYRKRFNSELPHPKMDALVAQLSDSWARGRKALVFLRRVASVWEVKERLDSAYNEWLLRRLRAAFSGSPPLLADLDELWRMYSDQRAAGRQRRIDARMAGVGGGKDGEQDRGGDDTFFAWFFRGEGPEGAWLSGAKFSQRFAEARYELSTVFEDNYAAGLLGVPPGQVVGALSAATGLSREEVEEEIKARGGWYITRAKRPGRREVFEAAQGGAVDLLRERARDESNKRRADVVWELRFKAKRQSEKGSAEAASRAVEYDTFFAALRGEEWSALRSDLWRQPIQTDAAAAFREQELRRDMLSTMARLGQPLVDLYAAAIVERGTLRTRGAAGEADEDDATESGAQKSFLSIALELLERQRSTPLSQREWGAFDELKAAAEHFDLILDVNEPGVRSRDLAEAGRVFGALLRQQQPVGGMTGQVNKTLVRQFRMPGYPLVLLSTDLLQEGEDLHTFCSEVYHYGLAWTPSSVEQRIGRVDRVRSKTERTATSLNGPLTDDLRLQVFFPHLEDTVERLQVRRVLRRMHEFIRLMHEGLNGNVTDSSKLNVAEEIVGTPDTPPPITTPLTTAFPVRDRDLVGRRSKLAVSLADSERVAGRLTQAARMNEADRLTVLWEDPIEAHAARGSVTLPSGRRQHFVVHLQSLGEHLLARCVSHIGRVDPPETFQRAKDFSRRVPEQLGVIEEEGDKGLTLTVEEEVLLGTPDLDGARLGWLIARVCRAADLFEQHLWGEHDAGFSEFGAMLALEGRVLTDGERA
jgi:superfamily II DNA or RNA helicase